MCFEGDVKATIDYGFAYLKIDACGREKNMKKCAALFNATQVIPSVH
jgi:hypothetical protein